MAGTITKNLKLKAVLDDQAFRKQIQELKKELGSVEMGGANGNAGGFDRSAKMLNDAAQALRQVADSFKKGGGSTGGVGASSARRKDIEHIAESVTKNASNKMKQYFDAERGKYTTLKPGEVYDQTTGKTYKRDSDHQRHLGILKDKQQKEEFRKADEDLKKKAREEEKRKAQERKKDIGAAKDAVAALLSRTGMGLPMARQAAQMFGSAAPSMMQSAGGILRGAGSSSGMMAGAGILGGTAGLVNLGADMYFKHNKIATMQAQREQLAAMGSLGGEGLGSMIEQGGRNDPFARGLGGARGLMGGALSGGLKGAASGAALGAGAGALFGGIGAVPGALIGGAIGGIGGVIGGGILGFQEGAEEGGSSEGSKRRQQAALGEASLKSARELRRARMNALTGGGVTGDQLTTLQGLGGMQGISAEETLSQFASARGHLGNTGAMENLTSMQRRMQMTGTSVEEQAAATETFMGARKGTTASSGMAQSFEVLKKGVAAGLDVSKSGQFLKLTSDYIRSSQGMGQIDTESIAQRLADSAAGFAGGGPITQTSLQQAAQLQDITKRESTSESGFAGLGNIKAIQDIYGGKLDSGQFMALSNLSSDATEEDVMKLGGGTKEQAQEFLKRKRNAQSGGLLAAGIDPESPLGVAFGGKESGVTSEQQMGRLTASGFKAQRPTDATTAALEGGIPAGPERESLAEDAKRQQSAFVKGMDTMTTETDKLRMSFGQFNEEMKKSIDFLRQYTDESVRNKTSR